MTPEPPAALPTCSPNEQRVLDALAAAWRLDFGYVNFAYLSAETGLDRKVVRRSVRALARKGLADYQRGLYTDDGEMAGAGYAATEAGVARAKEQAPK